MSNGWCRFSIERHSYPPGLSRRRIDSLRWISFSPDDCCNYFGCDWPKIQVSGSASFGNQLIIGSYPGKVVCHYLDVTNTSGVDVANISSTGAITCSSLTQTSPAAGTVLRQFMYTATEIGFTGTVSTTSNVTLGTKSYTPVSSSSYLNIHFGEVGNLIQGAGNDGYYFLDLNVDSVLVGQVVLLYQGTRHYGTSFNAVAGRYTNSSTTAKSITIVGTKTGGDDALQLGPYLATMLTITEVAR